MLYVFLFSKDFSHEITANKIKPNFFGIIIIPSVPCKDLTIDSDDSDVTNVNNKARKSHD